MKPRKYSSCSISRRTPGAASSLWRTRASAPFNALRRVLAAGAVSAPDGNAIRAVSPNGRPGSRKPPFSTTGKAVSTRGPSAKPLDSRSGSCTSTARATIGVLPTSSRSPSFSPRRSSRTCSTAAPGTPSTGANASESDETPCSSTFPARG